MSHQYSYSSSLLAGIALPPPSVPHSISSRSSVFIDNEPDYPHDYIPSPIHDSCKESSTSVKTESKSCQYKSNESEFSGLAESQNKSIFDIPPHAHPQQSSSGRAGSRDDDGDSSQAQYRNMKMKYLRSISAIPSHRHQYQREQLEAVPDSPPSSSYVSSSDLEHHERMQKRREDNTIATPPSLHFQSVIEQSQPLPSSSSSSQSSVKSVGLLSQLLSKRQSGASVTAPSSPSSPTSISSIPLASSSSSSPSSSIVSSFSSSSSSSSSCAPPFTRRTSPISIPKRMEAPSDGVRYRRAREPTKQELEDEEDERIRANAIASYQNKMKSSSSRAIRSSRDAGEFTFTDVFDAAPLMKTGAVVPSKVSSSRPIIVPSKCGVSNTARKIIPSSMTPSSYTCQSELPSSMIDGFLAL